jgi:hypothetical protein
MEVLNTPNLPTKYREMLVVGGPWPMNEGRDKNIGATVAVFPKLRLLINFWELNGGLLYNFLVGKLVGAEALELLHSPAVQQKLDFDAIEWPQRSIDFLTSKRFFKARKKP